MLCERSTAEEMIPNLTQEKGLQLQDPYLSSNPKILRLSWLNSVFVGLTIFYVVAKSLVYSHQKVNLNLSQS